MTQQNTNELFNQFRKADDDLSKAVEDEAGMEALERRTAAAEAIMYNNEIALNLRMPIAVKHCRDLCHENTLDVMSRMAG